MYFVALPWSISFRSKDKSADCFDQARAISDSSLGYNFLYAQVLIWQENYTQVREYLQRAQLRVDLDELSLQQKARSQRGIERMMGLIENEESAEG